MRFFYCFTYALSAALLTFIFPANAQPLLHGTTGHSGTGANIDVRYHRIQWTIDPNDATKSISGTVTTYFRTTQDSVQKITFDLSSVHSFTATYHGISIATARPSANVIELTLPNALPNNASDSVTIKYSGAPPPFSNYGEGYDRKSYTTTGYVTYTLAESYGDDDFWPCKADMQDKIDSAMDFIITVPSAFTALTNGTLVSNVISGANRILTYKHQYPIASYLVCVAVGRYNVFNRGTVNISGTNVPIQYYMYTGRGSNPATQLTAMDFCKQELVAFSTKFGDYPFKNEKYGMYEFGWGGGMEHQAFSALDFSSMSNWSVIAHELTHQWFGDKVTFATWNHLWLAEGFAQYGEVLAAELISGLGQNPATYRSGIKSTALSTSTTPVYLSDASIQNSNTIWTTANDNAVYKRGAMVVSMLRKLAGDAAFFQALKNYLADSTLAYKSATTDNLKNHFEAVLGYDLDPFFTDWIYGTGNPAYAIKWNNSGDKIAIKVASQTRSSGSTVSYFHTPIVLKIANGSTSTSVVIYDQNGSLSTAGNGISAPIATNTLTYTLSFTPTSVTFDPSAETLTTGTVTKDATINPLLAAPQSASMNNLKSLHTASGNQLSLLVAQEADKTSAVAERSEDGLVFTAIGEMVKTATGNGFTHTVTDKMVSKSVVTYYRVKITDRNGFIEYSNVVRIKDNSVLADGVSLRPNVVTSEVTVLLSGGWEKAPASITLFNSAGMMVKRERHAATSSVQLHLHDLAAGNYNLQVVRADGGMVSKPFIVIR